MDTKKRSGRKSKYTDDIPERVRAWCREGKIEKEIYKKLGVSHDTFNRWKNEKPELSEALKQGKEKVDDGVEESLLKRAMGYEYEEVHTSVSTRGGESFTEVRKIKKICVPDVTAQIFWLKNRRPDKWREKQEIDHKGKIETSYNYIGFDIKGSGESNDRADG